MNKCSLQLMQIINDILDYSKLSSDKMSLKKNVLTKIHYRHCISNNGRTI